MSSAILPSALSDQHAVVTGGGRGIGLAIATALAGAGARVSIMGRNSAVLEQALGSIAGQTQPEDRQRGGQSAAERDRLHHETVDVGDPQSVGRAFDGAVRALGPVSILVNNAGQAHSAPFLKTTLDAWQQMMTVNLQGAFLCCQAVLPGMLEAGRGRIINVASTAALVGYRYVAAYVAAKHGVLGLTRALALETATRGITVNAVCPGYTETDIVRDAVANIVAKTGRTEEQARAELARSNPQGRLVQPAQVAHAVLCLCLPGAEAITGQALSVSGGETT
jgi:NAD(P)-dependent dehydrogenase (short-subunit alcohol dehydrogenase family)